MDDDELDMTTYLAVMNHEEQYSIWPSYKPMPAGWTPAGKEGSKKECLDWIEKVWTDMRPLSLRRKLEALERS
jgi:MbtH protein